MDKRKPRTTQHPDTWRPVFLTALQRTGNVMLSCTHAGIERTTSYRHRRADPTFAAAWAEAMGDAGDGLEAEARRRAVVGVERSTPLLSGGQPIIDRSIPGAWIDEAGRPWRAGVSVGPKLWGGEYRRETVRDYADGLLILLLKRAKPEKYATHLTVDQGAVMREAERLAGILGVPLDVLIAEVEVMRAEGRGGP